MKIHRIYAIILRYLYLFRHNLDRINNIIYWPLIDLSLWGLTSLFFLRLNPQAPQIILIVLSGVILWLVVYWGQYEVSINLLEDLWNKNLINLFSSPLKFSEWISAFLLIGLIRSAISFAVASIYAYILYRFKIVLYGFNLLPFFILLIMSGWWVGFFVGGIILRYGTRLQSLAGTAIVFLAPFSAVYYPRSILPQWAQTISLLLPTSYIFEGAREIITGQSLDWQKVLVAAVLSIFYLSIGFIFLYRSFIKILDKGLLKLI